MKRLLAMVILLAASAVAFALPTVDAVQAEVQRGNYTQAESMMREVVAAKPESAKAHYIYAEILAHNKRFDQAEKEVQAARQADPELRFTQPEKFRAFEQLLEREQRTAKQAPAVSTLSPAATPMAAPVERSSGVPGWVWGAGFAVIAVLLWRMFSARRPSSAIGPVYSPAGGAPAAGFGNPGPGYGPGMAPGYGPGYGPGGGGSGMLGTGIAAAGGFAAGMLAEKLFDGHHERDVSSGSAAGGGGLVPGMFDDAPARNEAADELEQRPIDFGSGGDWGGSNDSSDAGGGSSDDGW